MDTLGCGLLALNYPACTKLLGPVVAGATMPGAGARIPGTSYELDPVRAAFNIGAMVRWLDFNDTWLAAEWGHPSDNLGGILAVADYFSRTRAREGEAALTIGDVLVGMIQAHEIQGVLALENALNRVGLVHVLFREGRFDRRRHPIDRRHSSGCGQRSCQRVYRRRGVTHLPACAQYGIAKIVGGWRCNESRGLAGFERAQGRNGLPERPKRSNLGLPGSALQGESASGSLAGLRFLRYGEHFVQDLVSG